MLVFATGGKSAAERPVSGHTDLNSHTDLFSFGLIALGLERRSAVTRGNEIVPADPRFVLPDPDILLRPGLGDFSTEATAPLRGSAAKIRGRGGHRLPEAGRRLETPSRCRIAHLLPAQGAAAGVGLAPADADADLELLMAIRALMRPKAGLLAGADGVESAFAAGVYPFLDEGPAASEGGGDVAGLATLQCEKEEGSESVALLGVARDADAGF